MNQTIAGFCRFRAARAVRAVDVFVEELDLAELGFGGVAVVHCLELAAVNSDAGLRQQAQGLAHEKVLPVDIGTAAQAESNHAGTKGAVRKTIDENERTGFPIVLVRIEGNRT